MWYWRRRGIQDVKGGIKLQSKRGESARSWWGQRWNNLLYSRIDGGRLSRGRTYARRGQVDTLDISKGIVRGVVYGSEDSPYNVNIKIKNLKTREWDEVAASLMVRPAIAAKLMAGQMPPEMEDVFYDAGVSLFTDDIETSCDCFDYVNPCKHIAAIYLILSEQLDRDPFLLFMLRGMGQEDLLAKIGVSPIDTDNTALVPDTNKDEPLPLDMGKFWGRESASANMGSVETPLDTATLPKSLGGFPYWRSEENFSDILDTMYQDASKTGMAVFLGEDAGK